MSTRYPSLYQINTRVWLTGLSRNLGRAATLDDVPDEELDRVAAFGVDWVWLLSVWRTGPAAQAISRRNPEWRREFELTLPDLREDDIRGSGFAITGYTVHPALGGDEGLARLRGRLRQRGLRLMLDFVPNHTAPDHPWVQDHPEYYVSGSWTLLEQQPFNYTAVTVRGEPRVLAFGRDPYFTGWPDTLQLDYSSAHTQQAMTRELECIATRCDGVRCDMAMLVLPDVFERTWGRHAPLFWSEAIPRIRAKEPAFCFMAEVYWDREWEMLQQGFDYAYDKRLYDRLHEGDARPVRAHLTAPLDYQDRLARFLENHDEPRAAAVFDGATHQAAAVVTFLSPGLRFFHQGQFEGRTRRISPHLVRAPQEPADSSLQEFYDQMLNVLRHPVVRDGCWQLLACLPAWDGNWTADCFVASLWTGENDARRLVVVNFAGNQSQCYVRLPLDGVGGNLVQFADRMGAAVYERERSDLEARGLYLDLPAWGYHVFDVTPIG